MRSTAQDLGRACIIGVGLDEDIKRLYRMSFTLFELTLGSDRMELRQGETGEIVQFVPQSSLAAVISALGSNETERVLGWAASVYLDVPVFRHHTDLPHQLTLIQKRVQSAAKLAADANFQLAELRKLHEEVQNSYAGLRDYLHEGGYLFPRLTFVNMPDPDGAVLPQSIALVEQRLPADLQSLCGISLYLRQEPASSQGELRVKLTSPDDDTVSYDWRVPYARLRIGWSTFAFEQEPSFIRGSAFLAMHLDAASKEHPLFSLGRPQFRPDRAAVIDGAVSDRSLALRAWTSLRGAHLMISDQMGQTFLPSGRGIGRIDIAINDKLDVIDLDWMLPDAGFPKVVLDGHLGRIFVHPLHVTPTIAEILLVCPVGSREINAQVITDNEAAGMVEFGLLVAPAGSLQTLDDWRGLADGVEWHLVPAKLWTTIRLRLEQPTSSAQSLYLLTRIPEGGNSDYCWSLFSHLYVRGDFK